MSTNKEIAKLIGSQSLLTNGIQL